MFLDWYSAPILELPGNQFFLHIMFREKFLNGFLDMRTVLRMMKSEINACWDITCGVAEIMALTFVNHDVHRVTFFDE